MKLQKKMIKDLPHKWMFSPFTRDVVVIDSYDNGFIDHSGEYCVRCTVQTDGKKRFIRYQNAIWYID